MEGLSSRLIARLAALLFLGSGLIALVTLPLPSAPGLNHLGTAIVGVIAIACGVAAWLAPWERWPPSTTLWVVPVGLALISAGNYVDTSVGAPYTFGVFFVVVFAWIGVSQRRWTSLRFAPLAGAAYLVPIVLHGSEVAARGSTAALTIPACVLIGESVSWMADRWKRSEQLYRELFETNPQPMWVYDVDTLAFLAVNEAAVRSYGYTREEFLSMTIREIRPRDEVASLEDSVRSTPPSPDSPTYWTHRKSDGTLIQAEITSHPVAFKAHRARLVLAKDVTERRRAEEATRRTLEREREAVRRLRALDEMKNTFLQAVSHDLRTPLTVILGVAHTLLREDAELSADQSGQLLRRLADNAVRLDKLLQDLLDLDRLTRGIIEPRRRPTDLEALVGRVVAGVDLLGRVLHVDTQSVVVDVDPAHVERIVENLLANVTKHTPAGTHAWVRLRAERGGALLAVDDCGPGVPAETRERIFDPFAQGSTSAHAPGTGIGLALVARFAELHGGRAWVEDRPGGGASFRVFLPPAPASSPPVEDEAERLAGAS